MSRSEPGTPRWRPLLALGLGVLLVHLWLLAGGLPRWHTDTAEEVPTSGPVTAMPASAAATGETSPAIPPVQRALASTVRWIVPTPPTTRPGPHTTPPQPKPVAPAPEVPRVPAAVPDPEPGPSEVPVAAAPPPPASEPAPEAVAPVETPAPPPLSDTALAAAPTASPGADAAQPLPSALPPAAVVLKYDVLGKSKGITYSADARLSWQPSGTRYTAELDISAFLLGSRVQTSSGRIEAQGLVPERFGDRRRSSEKAAHFDHAEQRIRYSSNAPDTPLLPGAQDRLSVFLQLAALLHTRPEAYITGQMIPMQVASTGSAEVWQFQVGPLEDVQLPAGQVNTRRLTRAPRREHDNTVEVWLAPALQFLPVRIRVTEPNGDVADQQLRQLPPMSPSQPMVQ